MRDDRRSEGSPVEAIAKRARERAAEMRKAAGTVERVHTMPPACAAARVYAERLREAAAILERPIETG